MYNQKIMTKFYSNLEVKIMIAKNKCGYELLEYIPCDEQEIINYKNVTGAGVVYKVGNKYLIGFNDWRMQWELPVGGIEEGESAKQAAIRELFEETHQKVDNVEFKGLFKKKRPKGEIVYTAIFFCEKDGIVPFVKNDADENVEIKLWDLKEDIGYVDEIDLKIIEILQG